MIPSYYEFFNPVKVMAGNMAVDNLPYELDQLGASRPLIITDKGVVGAGLLQFVVDSFSGSDATIGAVFDETPVDSSNHVVNELARIYRNNDCDSIVAVGGGSVLDTAKAVNILATEGGEDLLDFMGSEILKHPLKPFIAIPTTAGTGSEVTMAAMIADPDRGIKMPFTSHYLYPNVAILDPRMTLTMPPKVTAATGMDALTHAVESYTCMQKNPLSDAHASAAIALVRENLLLAVENGKDKNARFALANAALLAGAAFSNAMVGVVHSLAHAAGGVCHVPHGIANAIYLPHGMEYNMPKVGELYGELLLPLAGAEVYAQTPRDQRPKRAIQAVKTLNQDLNRLCGMPITLKEAGVSEGSLETLAEATINDGAVTFNPREVEKKDALKIIRSAYE